MIQKIKQYIAKTGKAMQKVARFGLVTLVGSVPIFGEGCANGPRYDATSDMYTDGTAEGVGALAVWSGTRLQSSPNATPQDRSVGLATANLGALLHQSATSRASAPRVNVTVNNSPQRQGLSRNTNSLPDFFVCNYIRDLNRDGKITDNEYIGVKTAFSNSEKITFVAKTKNKQGFKLTFKILAPNGEIVYNKTATISNRMAVDSISFPPRKGKPGNYKAVWEINNNFASSCDFELIN